MPALFLNSEVGACKDKDHAIKCVSRALSAYILLKKHITDICNEKDIINNLILFFEKEKSFYIHDMFRMVDKETRNNLQIFTNALLHGAIVDPPTEGEKTLKGLGLPSPLLEYALEQKGMVLSFANSPYWETDFIEFNEDTSVLPNIWGQNDFHQINSWLDAYYQEIESFEGIQRRFNVVFCCDNITEVTFTPSQWSLIYNTFAKAQEKNFSLCPPFIKQWEGLPILYIRDKQHSSFTLRIFFIKKEEKIYVGEIYHKNS